MDEQGEPEVRHVTEDRDRFMEVDAEVLFQEGWEGRLRDVARELGRQERATGEDYTEVYRQVSSMLSIPPARKRDWMNCWGEAVEGGRGPSSAGLWLDEVVGQPERATKERKSGTEEAGRGEKGSAAERILSHLDRCQHGRRRGDKCSGWSPDIPRSGCRGGVSLGNPWLKPGAPIGYDTYGWVIVVPGEGADLLDPKAWFLPGGELPKGHEHPDDDPTRRDWQPSRESWSWRCQRCNMTGSGHSTWWRASREASNSHAAIVCDLLVELTRRSTFYGPSTFELPPGTVVASKGATWIKEDPEQSTSTVSREFPWKASQWSKNCSDAEIDGMLTSGGAEILRVGGR
ncbi:MAG TPA: hypothetical protein VFF53_03465 [Geobacteraceae bacterium]|nr:hypothetical protein [Geobacteraceae bacterium]